MHPTLEITTPRSKTLSPEISELLSAAMEKPTPSALWKAWHDYTTNPNHRLLVMAELNRVFALVGVELTPDGIGTIHHIAVAPELRSRGVARRLVEEVTSRFPHHVLRAHPPEASVELFRRLGFTVRAERDKRAGVDRVVCEKRP